MEQKVTIQMRVPRRLRDELQSQADSNDMTLSEFARYVLRDYLIHLPVDSEIAKEET